MDRRRFAFGSLLLVAVALAALPAMASARIAYFTGSSGGMGSMAAPVELSTQTANPANQVSLGMSSEGSPNDVAIAPDGRTAYVVDASGLPNKVVPIDVATNKAGTSIPIPQSGRSIAITPDGRFAYVTSNFAPPDEVSKIDLAAGTVTSISVGHNLSGIAITPDGKTAYVVSSSDNAVFPIDVATNAVGAPIVVGNFPSAIVVTPNGTSAYVLVPSEEKLVRIEIATNSVAGAIPNVFGLELAIAPSGTKAYAVGGVEVTPVDLAAAIAATPLISSTQGEFQDVAILPDGSNAYITNQRFETSNFFGVMTPVAIAGDVLQPDFPLNVSFVQALAIVPNQPPQAAFTPSPASTGVNQVVSFDANASTDTDGGSVVRYDWDFGDGSVAANAGPIPQHSYSKPGTYTVTLTTTDNEGCSISLVFPGQTAYCNGSAIARTTRTVVVSAPPAADGPLPICPSVKASAATFIPKRRPGNVLPGVRVQLSTGVPAKMNVTAALLYRQDGKEASAGLGQISVEVNKWRRVRFTVPPELRQELPIGKPVKVAVRIETIPRDGKPCEATVVNRILKVHVVKVFPNRVQSERPR